MSRFQFKHFTIHQSRSALKVGTDAMLLGASIKCDSPKFGLDVGAGTGVLSLMVSQVHSYIFIDAIEIDYNSFEDLSQNIYLSKFKDRIQSFNKDFFSYQSNKKYDLIFSNPPFYDDGFKFDENILFHSKHNLNFSVEKFFIKSLDLLDTNGEIWVIVPYVKTQFWLKEANKSHLFLVKQIMIESKPGKEVRSILVFSLSNTSELSLSTFSIRDDDGFYTDEYHLLTSEFHNKKPLR